MKPTTVLGWLIGLAIAYGLGVFNTANLPNRSTAEIKKLEVSTQNKELTNYELYEIKTSDLKCLVILSIKPEKTVQSINCK